SYQFQGYVTSDPRGGLGIGSYVTVPFTVSSQSGVNLLCTMSRGNSAAFGAIDFDVGGWRFGTYPYYTDGPCMVSTQIGADAYFGFASGSVKGTRTIQGISCLPNVTYCNIEGRGIIVYVRH